MRRQRTSTFARKQKNEKNVASYNAWLENAKRAWSHFVMYACFLAAGFWAPIPLSVRQPALHRSIWQQDLHANFAGTNLSMISPMEQENIVSGWCSQGAVGIVDWICFFETLFRAIFIWRLGLVVWTCWEIRASFIFVLYVCFYFFVN